MTRAEFEERLREFYESGSLLLSTDTKFPRVIDDPRELVRFVINYDPPPTHISYDHRVGLRIDTEPPVDHLYFYDGRRASTNVLQLICQIER
eukprot:TRINITY_DN3764_c0_g1_i1.p1 TRINITY_DN3764_c0_g1~~TRINITY_DN3764_c0_g1_i1.p1  ORF type:complete len:92 (+),score=12.62 TRINITY_DN3764_c0_g1_i1:225-500(+)